MIKSVLNEMAVSQQLPSYQKLEKYLYIRCSPHNVVSYQCDRIPVTPSHLTMMHLNG